jgi:PAS domain S-box-containing protein
MIALTNLREASRAVSELEPRDVGLGELFWRTREAVVVVDVQGERIALWNPAAEMIFGYARAEAIGLPLARLIAETHRPRILKGLARYRRTGRRRYLEAASAVHLLALRKDGAEIEVEVALSALEAVVEDRLYVLAIVRDVTELRRAEEARTALVQEQDARAAAEKTQAALVELTEALDRALMESELLGAIATAAAGEDDLARILAVALAYLGRLVTFTGGSVALLEGEDLVIRSAVGVFAEAALGQRLPHRDGPTWRVFETGEPFLSNDLQAAGFSPTTPLRSYLAVPLVWRAEVFGILEIDSIEPNAFDEAALPLLRSVGAALSGPIQLARRYAAEVRAVAEAQAAEALYRSLFEGVADAILVTDARGRLQDANAAASELFGHDRDRLRQLNWTRLTTGGEEWARTELARLVQDGHWRGEFEIRRRDGRQVPVEAQVRAVTLPTGRRYIAVLRDIAERKALDRQKDEFLATISHDLKNPLTALKSRAQLLQRQAERLGGDEGERMAEGLANLDATVGRLTALIDALMDTTGIQMGRPLELQREPTDLVALAWAQAEEYQRTTEQHTLTVQAGAPSLVGYWDPVRLERALGNLLSNAIKYSPEGGTVRLALRRETDTAGEWAVLQVRDGGVGVPADELPHVFEQYYRGRNVAGRIRGSGLGLFGVRQIVAQHGGTIAVESREGVGTTFTVRLPLAAE